MRSDPSGDVGNDNRFSPDEIEVPAGRTISVNIFNRGDSTHDFSIEELDLNTGTIAEGETAHATFELDEGRTEFVCSYHGGMRGVFVAS
jgi:plastocyanin